MTGPADAITEGRARIASDLTLAGKEGYAWEIGAAIALTGNLYEAARLVEGCHRPEPALPEPIVSYDEWVPAPEPEVDTSVEQEFVRVALIRLAAKEARSE